MKWTTDDWRHTVTEVGELRRRIRVLRLALSTSGEYVEEFDMLERMTGELRECEKTFCQLLEAAVREESGGG